MPKIVSEKWVAPVAGWWQAGPLAAAPPNAAEKLDNFFPTTESVRLRAGSSDVFAPGSAIVQLMAYRSTTDTVFVSTATDLYFLGEGAPTYADWDAITSGDWSYTQMSTAAGEYMVAVNGADYAFFYDGTGFEALAGEAINNLPFDALTAAFEQGDTITGETSGATATIYGVSFTSATAGTIKVGAITGTFQDNEIIAGTIRGSATSNIPSGTSAAHSIAITGIATTSLTQVWSFKERLFFVEKDSQSVWYLPTESIGGAASEINLGSVFRRGGNVSFGAAWSLDSGTGLDDVCVIVSENGEVAIYQGTDPDSAATWGLTGVYDIGSPVNKHASFKMGGDLAIISEDGIIPISEAIRRDRASLKGAAITAPIENAWADAVVDETVAHRITATVFPRGTMLLVGVATLDGSDNTALVMNTTTRAWCRYTKWDVRCSVDANDKLYFGSNDGSVYLAETGGSDEGTAFTGVCVPKFTARGSANKFMTRALVVTRGNATQPTFTIKGLKDYNIPAIAAPSQTANFAIDAVKTVHHNWRKVTGHGFAISPAFLATSGDGGGDPAPLELISVDLAYEVGTAL